MRSNNHSTKLYSINYLLIFSSVVILFCFNSCSKQEIKSKWRERNITIDGLYDDWQNNLQFLKDKRIAFGIANDESDLYLCLVSSNRGMLFQMMSGGFAVWFDPQTGSGRVQRHRMSPLASWLWA